MPQETKQETKPEPADVNAQGAAIQPRPPRNPQEALANIERANRAALRRTVYGGLRNDHGKWETPTKIVAETCINLCLTFKLEPAMRELMLMNGTPYVPHKGYLKIADNDPLFRGLSAEPTDNCDSKAKYCQFKATVRKAHPNHPDDPNRDLFFTAYGDAAPDNVTTMISVPPKGTGSKYQKDPAALPKTDPDGTPRWGYIWAQAEVRAERNAMEKAFPLNIEWQQGPLVQETEEEPKVRDVEVEVMQGVADTPGAETAAEVDEEVAGQITPEQLEVVLEFAKSKYRPLVNLCGTHMAAHGSAGEWSKATASAFIEQAQIIALSRGKEQAAAKEAAKDGKLPLK